MRRLGFNDIGILGDNVLIVALLAAAGLKGSLMAATALGLVGSQVGATLSTLLFNAIAGLLLIVAIKATPAALASLRAALPSAGRAGS
ncbi:MAG: hypothetical protein R3D31_09185 [Hyphomicrobiaceae bacterium]